MQAHLKKLFLFILLNLSMVQPVTAGAKYYQYNGNLPFVEMMLNMMTVMGILDKVPPQLLRNPYTGYGGYNNLYNNYNGLNYYNNPLFRDALLNRQGLNMLGLNSFGAVPLSLGTSGVSPFTLGSPGLNSLGLGYPGYNSLGLNALTLNNNGINSLYSSPWSGTSLTGSPWDNALLGSFPERRYSRYPDYYEYDEYDDWPDYPYSHRSRPVRSPLHKYARSSRDHRHYLARRHTPLAKLREPYPPTYPEEPGGSYNEWRNLPSGYDSPCVTPFCGLRGPVNLSLTINGLWITDSGEMLGIKENRFLWSDGNSRYLTGNIRALGNTLVATVDGEEGAVMQYQYRLDNNRLITQDPAGLIRVFVRVPVN